MLIGLSLSLRSEGVSPSFRMAMRRPPRNHGRAVGGLTPLRRGGGMSLGQELLALGLYK